MKLSSWKIPDFISRWKHFVKRLCKLPMTLAFFRLDDMWLLIRSIILIEFCLTFEYRHSHPKVLIVTTTRTSIWSRYYFVSGFLIKTPYFGGCWAVKFLIITFIFFYEKRSFSNQYVCTQWFGINYLSQCLLC